MKNYIGGKSTLSELAQFIPTDLYYGKFVLSA